MDEQRVREIVREEIERNESELKSKPLEIRGDFNPELLNLREKPATPDVIQDSEKTSDPA